jgi:hypothetical protein
MARRKKEDAVRDLKPVLVRVPEDVYRVFEMARAAYQHRSMQELLRPVLEQHAETLLAKPQIQGMLRSSAELQAERSGTLHNLAGHQVPRLDDRKS